ERCEGLQLLQTDHRVVLEAEQHGLDLGQHPHFGRGAIEPLMAVATGRQNDLELAIESQGGVDDAETGHTTWAMHGARRVDLLTSRAKTRSRVVPVRFG